MDALNNKEGNLGVITFPHVAAKKDFYRKMQRCSELDEKYNFFDNLTFPERIRNKRLGYIEHHMISHDDYAEGDVKVIWDKNMVTLRSKKIAWYNDDNEIQMTTAAKFFEKEVEHSLTLWIAKRSNDPETDGD